MAEHGFRAFVHDRRGHGRRARCAAYEDAPHGLSTVAPFEDRFDAELLAFLRG
ncbi:hypothetical protein [Kitasatospora sp. NPDC056184]|uniref:hypothetical protein n=1 Tax=Kitasatospora sp. NPDC056184 TaxID=3345738 RepID=UPI0035D99B98